MAMNELTLDDPSRRRARLIVFAVVVIDLLGFGIVLPLIPYDAEDLIRPLLPGSGQRIYHGVVLGLLMSSFSLMQFLFAPVWGRISDKIGRRPILLLGLLGSVCFYALFGIASEVGAAGNAGLGLALMFAARLGAGLAGATISTAQAVIADTTAAQERSRGMALIGAAFGIGFTFGPILGASSLFLDLPGAPGFLAAGLSLIALVFGWARLPETVQPETTGLRRQWLDVAGFRTALATPTVAILILVFFLTTFAFGSLESTLSILNKVLLTPDPVSAIEPLPEVALRTKKLNLFVFAYVGCVLMLIQGGVYRPLARRVDEVRFMRVGLGIMLIGLVLACFVGYLVYLDRLPRGTRILPWTLPVLTLAVAGFAFVTPSVQSLISRRSDPTMQGAILGVNQSGSALARILGPFIGLSLFHLEPSHILPYASSVILLAIVFWMCLKIR